MNLFNPTHYFVLSFNKKILMSAKKIPFKNKYIISTCNDYNFEKENIEVLGVLKTNTLGTRFSLFDPLRVSKDKEIKEGSKIILSINYVCLLL